MCGCVFVVIRTSLGPSDVRRSPGGTTNDLLLLGEDLVPVAEGDVAIRGGDKFGGGRGGEVSEG